MKASTKSYLKRLARGQISIPWFIYRRLQPFRDLKLDLECRFNRAKPTLYGEQTGVTGEVLCTFVISHKNCAEFAGLCVESIKRNAAHISYEILIADDNSEDSEFSVIKKVAAPGVCVYRFPQSKGHSYMLEWLYYRAVSKFVVTLAQDTVLLSKIWVRLLD